MADHDPPSGAVAHPDVVTPAQVHFFRTFGFLVLRGLFRDEVATISEGFDEVFAADEPDESHRPIHYDARRLTVGPGFVERSDKLSWIKSDPRFVGVLTSLLGPGYRDEESDGNIFYCDTAWHSDLYGSDLKHRRYVKVYLYLDQLRRESGSLRVVPGTNSLTSSFATTLRGQLWEVQGAREQFGLDGTEIPSWPIEVDPGDVIFGDYLTLHAAFGATGPRRMFTMNFSSPLPDAAEG